MTGLLIAAALNMSAISPADANAEKLIGHWEGIEMYQDQDSYDGKTYYLPNSEEIVLEKNKLKVYFYPYFKSDEFPAEMTSKTLICDIGRKKVRSDYTFKGDTLILSMNFISKTFIKMYKRTTFDEAVIAELDGYGFNPSSLTNEYELDTFHHDLYRGFKHIDSLGFDPLQYIMFQDDYHMLLNHADRVETERMYQGFRFNYGGKEEVYRIIKVNGTQQFSLIPVSYCDCDSIQIPYLATSWAIRLRKKAHQDAGIY